MVMRRAGFLLSAMLLLAATACYRPVFEAPSVFASTAESTPRETPVQAASPPQQPVAASPSLADMMETIDTLCAAPRPVGSEAERQAALYLQERLEEYGYKAILEKFDYNITDSTLSQRYRQARQLTGDAFFAAALPGERIDGESQNVIGRHRGDGEAEKILVLSAHYDSTADSIGVVDNAAGVAVALEAARILAAEDLPFSLRVVFFGGEEEILLGSRLYLAGLAPREAGRIAGNITVDTLAYAGGEAFTVLTTLSLPDARALEEASPVAAAFLADERVTPAFGSALVGDHMSFAAMGIDSVNFGQSMDAVVDLINSPRDTWDLLEPELLPAAVQLLVDSVRRLAAETAS